MYIRDEVGSAKIPTFNDALHNWLALKEAAETLPYGCRTALKRRYDPKHFLS